MPSIFSALGSIIKNPQVQKGVLDGLGAVGGTLLEQSFLSDRQDQEQGLLRDRIASDQALQQARIDQDNRELGLRVALDAIAQGAQVVPDASREVQLANAALDRKSRDSENIIAALRILGDAGSRIL